MYDHMASNIWRGRLSYCKWWNWVYVQEKMERVKTAVGNLRESEAALKQANEQLTKELDACKQKALSAGTQMQQTISQLREELTALRANNSASSTASESVQLELNKAKDQSEALAREKAELQQIIDADQATITKLTADKDQLGQKVAHLEGVVRTLEQDKQTLAQTVAQSNTQASTQTAALNAQIAQLQASVSDLESKLAAQQQGSEQLHSSKQQEYEQLASQLRAEIVQFQLTQASNDSSVDSLTKNVIELQQTVEQLEASRQSLEHEKAVLEGSKQTLDSEVQSLKAQLLELQLSSSAVAQGSIGGDDAALKEEIDKVTNVCDSACTALN
jgi:chromosome segregation ATPase